MVYLRLHLFALYLSISKYKYNQFFIFYQVFKINVKNRYINNILREQTGVNRSTYHLRQNRRFQLLLRQNHPVLSHTPYDF